MTVSSLGLLAGDRGGQFCDCLGFWSSLLICPGILNILFKSVWDRGCLAAQKHASMHRPLARSISSLACVAYGFAHAMASAAYESQRRQQVPPRCPIDVALGLLAPLCVLLGDHG